MNISQRLILLGSLMVAATATRVMADDLADVVSEVDPSVVVLHTLERDPGARPGQASMSGLGSGVLIDDEGHVITAAHVVQTADFVEAEFSDGTRKPGQVIASSPAADVALLRLDGVPDGVRPARLGDSDAVRVGQAVFVIGAPYGLGHTLTVGHISSRRPPGSAEEGSVAAELFQTDAAINQGNSGGPMFNMDGEVIGVVSFILSQSGGFEGLGFAVTSNAMREELFERGRLWTGLSGTMLSQRVAAALNVPQATGYLVQKVAVGSFGAELGLMPSRIPAVIDGQEFAIGGDIILSVDGVALSPANIDEIRDAMGERKEGDTVKVRVVRLGRLIDLVGVF